MNHPAASVILFSNKNIWLFSFVTFCVFITPNLASVEILTIIISRNWRLACERYTAVVLQLDICKFTVMSQVGSILLPV